MKLLWLTENYYPNRGGMAQSCDRITRNLALAGVQIDIVHFTSRKRPFQEEIIPGGTYVAVPFEEDESHTLNKAWSFLSTQIEEKNYNFIVAFGGALPVLAGPIYSAWASLPLATFIRGNDFDSAIFSQKRNPIISNTLSKSLLVFSVSQHKIKKISAFCHPEKVHYVPNGIDLDEWQPLKSEIVQGEKWKSANVPADRKLIGLFGHLKAKKGLDVFLEALRSDQIKKQVHLLLVGELDEEIEAQMTEQEISFSRQQFLDRHELLPYYHACDAIALPSWYEGMPNVLLEASTLGKPCIASDVDGMHDVLSKKDLGFLFEPGRADRCRKAILSFLESNESQTATLSEQLKEEMANQYTSTQEAERILNILELASQKDQNSIDRSVNQS